MVVARTIGPRVMQLVLYKDAVYGSIAAIITATSSAVSGGGLVSLTTFPPGVAPQFQSNVAFDFTGSITGRWRYHETDVI
jgi:hypothetical protein